MIEPYQVQEWRDNSLGDLPLNGKVSNMVEWSVVLNDGGQKCRLLYHQTSIVGEVEKFVEMGISKNTTIFRNVYFYIFSYFDLGSVLQHRFNACYDAPNSISPKLESVQRRRPKNGILLYMKKWPYLLDIPVRNEAKSISEPAQVQ